MMKKIIIVGAGNSGIEAANIISKMSFKAMVITNNIENIGTLSCNPSMGGVGKSNLIREVDSLGGLIGYLSTKSAIQLKKINTSKGEAVSCTRAQIDRKKYKKFSNEIIKKNKNISIIQDEVKKIIIKNNKVTGVKTLNNIYRASAVILTTGTFLNGLICIGLKREEGGRIKEKCSSKLSEQLNMINKNYGRLKTGTPPRIFVKKDNLKKLKIQKGDKNPIPSLSTRYRLKKIKEKKCWITNTTQKTKEIIKKNLKNSPIYKNIINGVSPRYCPSIEDKIYKFYNIKKHNVFLEPDGANFYPSGISTSLPYNIQLKIIRSLKGLEESNIIKPGYAVEYDFYCPKNLNKALESKNIKGLFYAGQINGTTGYEEAAAQGIVAGINAVLKLKNKKYWYPNKKNSYIGIMLNDIIKNGITEPYRIFTNRSRNNLNLRENNTEKRMKKVIKKLKISITINKKYNKKKMINIFKKIINLNNLIFLMNIKNQIKIYLKYKNYINFKMKNKIKKISFIKSLKFKKTNYFKIKNLSKENAEKLNKIEIFKTNDILSLEESQINIILKYLKNRF